MNDWYILLLYPGVPGLLIILSPWLNGDNRANKGWQALWLGIGFITGPVIGGMWGLAGGIAHLVVPGGCFCNSILWHIIPFALVMIVGWGYIVPKMEKVTGRPF